MRSALVIGAVAVAGMPPLCGCSVLTSYDDLQAGSATAGSGGGATTAMSAGGAGGGSVTAGGGSTSTSAAAGGAGGMVDPQTYAEIVMTDHPVAYWRLGETPGSNTAEDVLGAHAGAYVGAMQLGVPGALLGDVDTAAQFLGGAIVVGDSGPFFDFVELSPISLEAWVRVNSAPPDEFQTIASKVFEANSLVNGYALSTIDGLVNFARWHDDAWEGADYIDGGSLQIGAFTHVVASFDGTAMHLYVDGLEVASDTSYKHLGDRDDPFVIGADNWGDDAHIDGDIDEVAVYDYALPADRVTAHRAAGAPPK